MITFNSDWVSTNTLNFQKYELSGVKNKLKLEQTIYKTKSTY